MDRCIQLTIEIEKSNVSGKRLLLREFKKEIEKEEWQTKLEVIRSEVEKFALTFPMPGLPAL